MLEKNGLKLPGFRKTGTTIVGLVFQVRPPTLVASPFHIPVQCMSSAGPVVPVSANLGGLNFVLPFVHVF
jgi:hypothetical protein